MDLSNYNDDARGRYEHYLAKHHIFSEREVLEIYEKLKNAYDRFVLLGIYEGLGGEGYTELFHVKLHQFHEDGTMTTFLGRTITVSDRLVETGQRAYRETTYRDYDGAETLLPMLDSRFVLKKFLNSDLSNDAKRVLHVENLLNMLFFYAGFRGYTGEDLRNSGALRFIRKGAEEKNMTQKYYLKCFQKDIKMQYRDVDLLVLKTKYAGFFDF